MDNWIQLGAIIKERHGWLKDVKLDGSDEWLRTAEFDAEKTIARFSEPRRITSLTVTGLQDITSRKWS